MLFTIEHRTRYEYSEPLQYTIQQLRLTPQDNFGQRVIKWDIKVNGQLARFNDAFGNVTHTLVLDKPHWQISIVAIGEVETELPISNSNDSLPVEIYLRETALTASSAALKKFSLKFKGKENQGEVALDEMVDAIILQVPYSKGVTNAQTSAADAFEKKAGVCQDHAHIFIACCRLLGLPARYVSGYLFTQDGSLMESHGWADVWLKESGWQSFDVSNQCHTSGVHIRLAVGLDYHDACPVSGMRNGGGVENMEVSVVVNQTEHTNQAQKIQQIQSQQ